MRSVAAALALSVAATGCAAPGRLARMTPSASMRPGSCHRLAEAAELRSPSDVAPPVPCATPHETETFALVRLPTALARRHDRPDEAANLSNDVCSVPAGRTLRAYLGADDLDRHWGVDVHLTVPTRTEWRGGLRLGRCDLVLGAHAAVPELDHRLRGALRRTDSAMIRHCRHGADHVTCDRPHTAEEVGGWTGITGTAYPGYQAAARSLDEQCWRNAELYTGGTVDTLPVRPSADPLSAAQWRAGVRGTSCWLVNRYGRITTGTLRAGLTEV